MSRENCALCGKALAVAETCIGVYGGGLFHSDCYATTYSTATRVKLWWNGVLRRLKGRSLEDALGNAPVWLRGTL